MSFETLIKDVGNDIEIIRDGKSISRTKAVRNFEKNMFRVTINTDVIMDDLIQEIETVQTYRVLEVEIAPNRNHKVIHIQKE